MSDKHTPEPWIISTYKVPDNTIRILGPLEDNGTKRQWIGDIFADETKHANSKRIVQCVNACAGMEDPAKEIADLKTQISTLQRFRIEDAASAMDDYNKLHSEFTDLRARLDLAVKALETIESRIKAYPKADSTRFIYSLAFDTLTKLKGESHEG